MYIVLGVLYESYIHPLTILSTLPSAGVGALLALELRRAVQPDRADRHYAVDREEKRHHDGRLRPRGAAQRRHQRPRGNFRASLLRFRPIMMTTLAAVRRAAADADQRRRAELRQPLGITIAGGPVMSQLLTLYTTPVVYLYFDRLQAKFRRNKQLAPLPH